MHGTDVDVKAFFDTLRVERARERAILTATVPQGFIKKALAEAPSDASPVGAQTAPQAPPAAPTATPESPTSPASPKRSPKPRKP